MTRRPIVVMPADMSRKIAAGEVVERPSSVVKELIDNAIDAGASTVRIEIREAGMKLIRVSDDGYGVPRNELGTAFLSHATNKIMKLEDLEQLSTLGFRGEALASIAAVSRVEAQTRTQEERVGSRLEIEFGARTQITSCAVPAGFRIAVSDLFANVPARRSFVRSLRSETAHIHAVVSHYALARPDVRLILLIDSAVSLESPGNGRLSDVAAEVFGMYAAENMLKVEHEEAGIAVAGLVSKPGTNRHNRSSIVVCVNGRPVANRSFIFALEEAYHGTLMNGRHPLAIMHVTVPPQEVDANVHPSKNEVRLVRDREVHGAIFRATSSVLHDMQVETRHVMVDADPETLPFVPQPLPLPNASPVSDTQPQPLLPGLPVLRVFGQSNLTFIVAEGPEGLYMIDQHAAHERILFDRLSDEMKSGTRSAQTLLEPAVVDLSPDQLEAMDSNHTVLQQIGFVLEHFGESSCLIRSVPALPHMGSPIDLVGEVLTELQTVPEPAAAQQRALAMVACKAAVKAGQSLDVKEMQELVAQLERAARPSTCPHGRPTMIHLSHSQLEREFGRR